MVLLILLFVGFFALDFFSFFPSDRSWQDFYHVGIFERSRSARHHPKQSRSDLCPHRTLRTQNCRNLCFLSFLPSSLFWSLYPILKSTMNGSGTSCLMMIALSKSEKQKKRFSLCICGCLSVSSGLRHIHILFYIPVSLLPGCSCALPLFFRHPPLLLILHLSLLLLLLHYHHPDPQGFHVPDLVRLVVKDKQQALALLKEGQERSTIAATTKNQESSRGHSKKRR